MLENGPDGIFPGAAGFFVVGLVVVEMAPGAPGAEVEVFHVGGVVVGVGDGELDPNFPRQARQTRAFENLAASQSCGFTVIGSRETRGFPGRTASATFFATVGIAPSLGRNFLPQDDRPELGRW
jgi:hypothetical protein